MIRAEYTDRLRIGLVAILNRSGYRVADTDIDHLIKNVREMEDAELEALHFGKADVPGHILILKVSSQKGIFKIGSSVESDVYMNSLRPTHPVDEHQLVERHPFERCRLGAQNIRRHLAPYAVPNHPTWYQTGDLDPIHAAIRAERHRQSTPVSR